MAIPTPPTALVDVALGTQLRRGVPLAVAISTAISTAISSAQDDDSTDGTGGTGVTGTDGATPDRADLERPEPVLGPYAERLGVDTAWLAAAGMTGAAGTVHDVALPPARPSVGWVFGIGAGGERDYRRAGAALVKAVDARAAADHKDGRHPARSLQVALPAGISAEQAAAFVLGAVLGSYDYRVTGQDRPPRTRTVTLIAPAEVEPAVRRALVLARATALTRDLANTPSNAKNPSWLANTAARIATAVPGVTVRVRDVDWLRQHGFGGVLAVGGGSARPPRLLELSWRPRGSGSAPHLALVGKGVTFDTGGVSIKRVSNMHVMRTDMAGGGAVVAAVVAIAQLRLPVRVTGLVPLAENHLSGSAYRPGDVVRHVDGRTTAVTNTDAEGRMLLADCLGYAVRTVRPDLLVDVATLTGSIRVSLGWRTGGFFSSDDHLADALVAAGERAGEAWWRMPLGFDTVDLETGYVEKLRSQRADVEQCPPGPGAIAAALFLREFTGGLPWAHLDIAGAARSEKAFDEVTVGATGFAARTLVELADLLRGVDVAFR